MSVLLLKLNEHQAERRAHAYAMKRNIEEHTESKWNDMLITAPQPQEEARVR